MVAPLVKRIWIWCRNLLIFLFVSSILAVVVYKFVPVYYTPLMFIRMYEQHQDGKKMKLGHTWVPISKIAQPLVQAVIASEDNLFMEHNGFDVEQIQKARAEAEKGKRVRGASTISQQTAKNVFLWPGKSYLLGTSNKSILSSLFTAVISALLFGVTSFTSLRIPLFT